MKVEPMDGVTLYPDGVVAEDEAVDAAVAVEPPLAYDEP